MEVFLFIPRKHAVLALAICALILVPAVFAGTITYSKLESTSGWSSCASTSCAGGGGSGVYWMKKGIGSPSLDGSSAQYYIYPKSSFYDALWWRHLTTNAGVSHFRMEMYQYLKSPSASQAIEYATNQYYNGAWYKYSTQCAFAGGIWRVWDSYHKGWVSTSAPCRRPAASSWTHLVFEYARASGRAVFVAITVNGQKYYINKSFAPQKTSGGNGDIGVHYQLDGNSSRTSYSAWVDNWSLTIW